MSQSISCGIDARLCQQHTATYRGCQALVDVCAVWCQSLTALYLRDVAARKQIHLIVVYAIWCQSLTALYLRDAAARKQIHLIVVYAVWCQSLTALDYALLCMSLPGSDSISLSNDIGGPCGRLLDRMKNEEISFSAQSTLSPILTNPSQAQKVCCGQHIN